MQMSRSQILKGSDNQRFISMAYTAKPNEQPLEDSKLKSGDLQQKVQAHFNSGVQDIQLDGEIINEFQFYRKYNEKFNQQFNEMFENKNFSVYQKNLLQPPKEQDEVYQFLIPTETLNPLLHKLETENKMLKVELNYIGCDLKKFIVMVEILLDENKFIREHINQKNRDISKLIESIGVNESEEVHDLKHKIHIINEENNILLRHLQEMKKYKDQYDTFVQNSDAEIQSSKMDAQNLKDDLENALRREENLTKQLAILEPKYSKETDKTVQLEANLEECSLRLNNYQNEILMLKNENGLYKRTYEEQNKKLKQEIETLNYQIQKFQQQYNNYVEGQIELKKQNDFLKSENQNLLKELEESRNDQVPIQQYLEEFKNQLQIERQKVEHISQIDKGLKEKLDNSLNQNDKLNLKLQQLEHQYNNLLNSSKFDLQEKHNKYEEILKNLQFSYKQQLEEKEEEIVTISQQLNQQKSQIDKISQELEFKSRQLNELKLQQIDIQDQKRKIESLELHNKLQTKEISELNTIITNYKLNSERQANYQKENEDLLKQIKKQENQISQLQSQAFIDSRQNHDIQIIRQSNEALQLQKENLEVRNENLKKEVQQLRQELSNYVSTNIDLRVNQQKKIQIDNEQLQFSNKQMQQQINQMTFANLQNISQNIKDDTLDEQIINESQQKQGSFQNQNFQNQKAKINKQDWINYQQK